MIELNRPSTWLDIWETAYNLGFEDGAHDSYWQGYWDMSKECFNKMGVTP